MTTLVIKTKPTSERSAPPKGLNGHAPIAHLNLLEADHKNKIYCGEEIFEVIMAKFKVARTKGPLFLGGVKFHKLSILKPNQLLTMDPALKAILEHGRR